MRQRWRWAVVVAVVAVLAAAPTVVRVLPVAASSVRATTLLQRVKASGDVAYSGYAQTQGGLALPVSGDAFGTVSDLFGGSQQLRVWWRGAADWRVDTLDLTGETDLHREGDSLRTWDYESGTARDASAAGAAVRLPRSDDLVPGNLARRLLSEVDATDVTRLATKRIAGRTAAGLRVTVHDSGSTVTAIDVWALPGNGLPLSVAVYTRGSRTPLVSSRLLDVSLARPAVSTVAFHPVTGTRVDGDNGDIVSALDTFGSTRPPTAVAGLARRTDLDLGAVGVYGHGVTTVVAVPLPARLAGQVVPSLRTTPGAVEDSSGIAAGVGALNVQLGPPVGFGDRWLLVGTVTAATLRTAIAQLPTLRPFYFGRRGR